MWKMLIYVVFIGVINPMLASNSYVDFSNRGIVDDERMALMRGTKSVSDVIKYIDSKGRQNIKKINLSNNNISNRGATQIINYAVENLQNIEEIDLSGNWIDYRPWYEYDYFGESLGKLLGKYNFRTINLHSNDLGFNWYKYIMRNVGDLSVGKIQWG